MAVEVARRRGMKIGILETGRAPRPLQDEFGDYPAMFMELLGAEFGAETFDVAAGELPGDPDEYEAYLITGSAAGRGVAGGPDEYEAFLITGSPAGVYEPLRWIDPLCSFIREAKDSKMVGV